MATVFVSGANGYIAQHLVVQLVDKGYHVIGTVRSKEKGENMLTNIPQNFTYEIVPDILKPDAFDEALKKHPEALGFFHTASPVSFSTKDFENDMILPGIRGTTNVMNSIKKHAPNIKRFVYTSSFAAVRFPGASNKHTVTEKTWNPIARDGAVDGESAYRVSKTWDRKKHYRPVGISAKFVKRADLWAHS